MKPPPPGIVGMLIKRFEGDPAVVVEALTPGAPAAACGLIRVGDRLLSVDGQAVAPLSLDAIHDLIDGPAGGSIYLVLQRGGVAGTPRTNQSGWGGSPESGGGFLGALSAARNAFGASGNSSPRPSQEYMRSDNPRDLSAEYKVTLVRMEQGMQA